MIGEIPFRFATVIAHKPSLHTLDKKGDHGDLYHFISMLLLERISWICRDACKQRQDGDGTARILFSERKQIQYERFIATARNLGENAGRYESYTEWAHINLDAILAQPHGTRDGFRVADFVASAFGRAIEPKKHGLTDDRFIIPWSQQIYRPANGGCLSNGLKFYPMGCEKGLLTEDRFRWFTTHYSP